MYVDLYATRTFSDVLNRRYSQTRVGCFQKTTGSGKLHVCAT